MSVDLLNQLRTLRSKSVKLGKTVSDDYRPFQQFDSPLFYSRLPRKPKKKDDAPSVTPTCTAWMALSSARVFAHLAPDAEAFGKAYATLLTQPWDTGGLPQNNAFTVAVVARAVGMLVDFGHIPLDVVKTSKRQYNNDKPSESDNTSSDGETWRQCNDKSLCEILLQFLAQPNVALALNPFPASPTIAYWMIDAASLLEVDLTPEIAVAVVSWSATEFRRQHSLVAANQQATMDPVALAMAACVCMALRRMSKTSSTIDDAMKTCLFPGDGELKAGIAEFFRRQNEHSGVWEKYFPIFHYPESGPNHCWHFEVLEAVLAEFPGILRNADVLCRLDRSLSWLESNRLVFRHKGVEFRGWNAGGDIQAMRQNEPESWPTGVAHMFLAKLSDGLSECIRDTVLSKYGDRVKTWKGKSDDAWNKYLDFTFLNAQELGLGDRISVKAMIEKEILLPAEEDCRKHRVGPNFRLSRRRSAVLFGPPGTSKTTLCEAVAERLGWRFLELSPSDFLGGGLEGIYNKVAEIFDDLMDLYGVVVLFDEMDALVRSRDTKAADEVGAGKAESLGPLDVTQQLLTTSMLPKLQQLRKSGKSVFFMATNYIGTFDGAIIRSGRFDLLCHMGPPSTTEKIKGLRLWCKSDSKEDIETAQVKLETVLKEVEDKFDRFTFGETDRFIYSLRLQKNATSEARGIIDATDAEIRKQVTDWADSKITLNEASKAEGPLFDYLRDAKRVSIQ
jgi:hypothetical protein